METIEWCKGDGISIRIQRSELHYIDRPNFEAYPFTLAAAHDPTPAYAERKDLSQDGETWTWTRIAMEDYEQLAEVFDAEFMATNYRIVASRDSSSAALRFKRRLLIEAMLRELFDGHAISEEEFLAIKRNSDGRGRFIFNFDTLFSVQMNVEEEMEDIEIDFPRRLQLVFNLQNDRIAWIAAWVLARAALSERFDLVRNATTLLTTPKTNKSSGKKLDPRSVESFAKFVDELKSLSLVWGHE